jgi:hypothetical protein
MAKQRSEYELIIKATDAYTREFDKFDRRVSESARIGQALERAGSVADVNPLKKLGKFVGGATDLAGIGEINKQADTLRADALRAYRGELEKALQVERQALTIDKARAGAAAELRAARIAYNQEQKQIDAQEQAAVGSAVGREGRFEARDDANMSRAAAEKAYQEVLQRTQAVMDGAKVTDQQRLEAIHARTAASRAYHEQVKRIAAAEEAAAKSARSAAVGVRAAAAAGGILLAVRAAGALATAYDEANEKLEKGQITAGMFWAEWAKGVPIIGGVVSAAENALMVMFGVTKQVREANEEAARTQKTVQERIDAGKAVDGVIDKNQNIGESRTDAIRREAQEKLAEIARVRADAKAKAGLSQEQADELTKIESQIAIERDKELAKIMEAEQGRQLDRRRAHDQVIIEDQRALAALQVQTVAESLREQGQVTEAGLVELRAKFQGELQAIEDMRRQLDAETGLSAEERIQRGQSLDARADGVRARQAAEEGAFSRRTIGERMSAIGKGLEDLSQPVNESRREQAQREYNKTLEDERKLLQQINELEKDAALTQEQRNQLAQQRAEIQQEAEEKRKQIEASLTVATQGQRFFGSVDARFSQRSTAAAGDIEVFRQSLEKPGGEKGPMEEVAAGQKKQTEIMIKMQTAIDRLVANIGPPVTA